MKNLLIILLLSLGVANVYAETQNTAENANNAQAKTKSAPVAKKTKKSAPKATMVDLETAYKREFAFLAAQKRELKKRLASYKKQAARNENKMERQIDTLEQSSVENSSLIDNLDTQLADAERTEIAFDERSDVLDMTFNQAETTLNGYGIDITKAPEFENGEDQKINYIFQQALALVQKLGDVRSESGKFYLRDGKETNGQIISLGNIAAFGVSEQGSGALAPAGGENFKLWKESTEDVALAISNDKQPDVLKMFLFESRTTAIEERAIKTWLSVIESGGIIGWVIVVLGVIGMLLILVRCYLLFMNSRDTKQVTEQVVNLVNKGDLHTAKEVCSKESCAITRVMSSTLRHLKDDRDHMEDIIAEAILNESGPINRYGPAILVIASVAPLLGLLGTVTGMISTFDIITEFGTGDPKLLSSGISVALVTTELGLIVAIPTLMFGSLLGAWANGIKRDMEKSALKITNSVLGGSNTNIAEAIKEQLQTGNISSKVKAA